MSIKSILCIFNGPKSELNAVSTALQLAKSYRAQVRFLHVSPDPTKALVIYGDGFVASAAIMDAVEKDNRERLQQAREQVVFYTEKYGVPLDGAVESAHHASAEFVHVVGELEGEVEHEGRVSDLIIVGRDVSDAFAVYDTAVIAALFNTGRPVLVMPVTGDANPARWDDRVVSLAWDGSLEASRAFFNALPLIEKAGKLHLLIVREHGKVVDSEAVQGIERYVHAHGFQAQVTVMDRQDREIGELLLTQAMELRSNLLVMGAYSHSRFREMILGGATKTMLEKADLPLLLSH